MMRERLMDGLGIAGVGLLLAGLLVYPQELTAAAKNGLELVLNVLLPALFPFFVVSELVVRLGLAEGVGRLLAPVTRKLFRVGGNGAAAVVLGFVGGYPVGARTVIALYRAGSLSRQEAERLLAFSNNAGPAFLLGVVGPLVFGTQRTGLWLYAVHAAASLVVGLLFRRWGKEEPGEAQPVRHRENLLAVLPLAIREAFLSAWSIGGFILFFTVLTRLLYLSGVMAGAVRLFLPLGFSKETAEELLTGFLELTSGVWSLRDAAGALETKVALTAFLLGWAGLSVHCQVLSFLSGTGLSAVPYLVGKLIHALLSALLTVLLFRFTGERVAVFLAQEVTRASALTVRGVLRVTLPLALGVFVLALALGRAWGSFLNK